MNFIPQIQPDFDEREARAVSEYMISGGWITEFKKTEEFENMLSEFTGTKHCIVTNNGTVSLSLALMAAGIKTGDEVLVPDLTMIATANAATLLGAKPLFVDVEPQTLCMDIKGARAALSPRTTALIYVSLHGRCGNMEEVKSFCERHHLFFLEDAAQSMGSFYMGKHLGRFGAAGCFSFSMPKIITTGQGGAVITDDDTLSRKLRRLKDFGRAHAGMDVHDSIGYNFKFTDLQAVIGIEQMKKLPDRMIRKRAIYKKYEDLLKEVSGITMLPMDLTQTTPWFIDIYVEQPDNLAVWLKEQQIGTRRIHPAIHLQKAYSASAHCPHAVHASERGLWLPSSVQLQDEEINTICEKIVDLYNRA